MKKLMSIIISILFALSVSGLCFAQGAPAPKAEEKKAAEEVKAPEKKKAKKAKKAKKVKKVKKAVEEKAKDEPAPPKAK
jgi:uncharacterized protein YlxW (UPF0749 family)